MKESYAEGLATHSGPESCGVREHRSVDRGTRGPGIEPRKKVPPGRRRSREKRKAPPDASISRDAAGSRAV